MSARVPIVVRWPGWNPRSTIATGMSTGMPWRARPAVSDGSEFTPMSTTIVPPRPARCVSSPSVSGAWPDTTVKRWLMPRCVSGMPAAPGTATALVTPGMTSTRDAGAVAREHLLAAATEHVGVAALEPHDVPAGERVLDEQLLDLVLRYRVVARALADVDELGGRGEPREALVGREPVVEHDVGRFEGAHRGERQQVLAARPAADERHAAGHASAPRTGIVVPATSTASPRSRSSAVAGRSWPRSDTRAIDGSGVFGCVDERAEAAQPLGVGERGRPLVLVGVDVPRHRLFEFVGEAERVVDDDVAHVVETALEVLDPARGALQAVGGADVVHDVAVDVAQQGLVVEVAREQLRVRRLESAVAADVHVPALVGGDDADVLARGPRRTRGRSPRRRTSACAANAARDSAARAARPSPRRPARRSGTRSSRRSSSRCAAPCRRPAPTRTRRRRAASRSRGADRVARRTGRCAGRR